MVMNPALPKKSDMLEMRKGGVNILMSCGRTGGHIKNAINLARYLKTNINTVEIKFVIPEDFKFTHILQRENLKYYLIPVKPTPSKFSFTYIYFTLKMLQSFIRSVIIINKVNPGLIIGFGSYSSLPVILAAFIKGRRIPVIIHEQNVVPGRANLFLAKFADRVAVSFKETERYFDNKSYFTGNPIREDLCGLSKIEASKFLGLETNKFNILITGGSQGSEFINNLMIEVVNSLPVKFKEKLQIIHLTGMRYYTSVKDKYNEINFEQVKIYGFLEEIEYALAASDIIISRAGAMTISEIAAFGKPAILIPYPYARAHQRINAEHLKRNKAVIVFNQEDINIDNFKKTLMDLITNKHKLDKMAELIKNLVTPGANKRFTDLIFKLCKT